MGDKQKSSEPEPEGEPGADVTPRTTFGPLLVAGILAGNLLAWLTGWQVPW